jgi:diacylglycerol kinase (ATP)
MNRFKVILNPTSNKGGAEKLLPEIQQELSNLSLDFEIVRTEYPGHAIELAYQAAMDGFHVVAAGGDGTCNEVLNGLMLSRAAGNGKVTMGVIPIGRGNDFNYSMGNKVQWHECCKVLADGKTHKIDVGCVKGGLYPEGRYFGNGVGIGFDAVVGFIAAKQRLTGFLGYLVAALRTMALYSPAPVVEVKLEGETLSQPSLMVTIMNGTRLGGGFMIAPKGNPSDGQFDLCIAHEVSRPKILYLITKFMQGTQYAHPAVEGRKSKKMTIRALKGSLPVHADGETIAVECPEITIELLPKQIDLFLPE